jgi:excisionase family DNA binding protein
VTVPLTTPEVARLLGVGYYSVWRLVQRGKITVAKTGSGDLAWSLEDVAHARQLLEARRQKAAVPA